MRKADLVKDGIYEVVANNHAHEFEIGEHVRFAYDDGDAVLSLVCYNLDGSDYWFMTPEELEPVQ